MFWRIAWQSLQRRKASVVLTVGALTLSIFVLVGIEHLRQSMKTGFARTVSGVDLIVGARSGDINLLLYSVFHLGSASHDLRWSSYQEIAALPQVAWTIPISLGDSHKGYKVLGTNGDYFTHYRYSQNRPLVFARGKPFSDLFHVVLGAEVARRLGYVLGDRLVLSHGAGSVSFTHHDAYPFVVVGILAPTGTPVDQTLHIDLAGLEAMHSQDHASENHLADSHDFHSHGNLAEHWQPHSITAFMLGLRSRTQVFQVQHLIGQYGGEPLQAIIPGAVLIQLWSVLAVAENTLSVISLLVLVAALFGMAAMLLATLRERRWEMALMRTLGAGPLFIALLLQMEVLLMVICSVSLAFGLLTVALNFGQSLWIAYFGLHLSQNLFSATTILFLLLILAAALLAGLAPALSAYRMSQGLVHRMD
jgi:putative ABC transport system permease protein